MRPTHKTQRRNYDKVLLAAYIMADDEGLLCTATNAMIAKTAGLSPETTKSYLHSLDWGGVVTTFRGGGFHRIMVLMDHPRSAATVRRLRRTVGLSDAEVRARDERAMKGHRPRTRRTKREAA